MTKRIFLASLPIGLLIFVGCNVWARFFIITDFIKGFFEGMSAVFVVIGLIYLIWSIVKKENA